MTISDFMRSHGWTQARLAEALGTTVPTLRKWLGGAPVSTRWAPQLEDLGIRRFPRAYTARIVVPGVLAERASGPVHELIPRVIEGITITCEGRS